MSSKELHNYLIDRALRGIDDTYLGLFHTTLTLEGDNPVRELRQQIVTILAEAYCQIELLQKVVVCPELDNPNVIVDDWGLRTSEDPDIREVLDGG